MSLLHEIQEAIIRESDLGPIFLRLQLFAARLGSGPLAEWVKHESSGYPPSCDVPDYRVVPVSYTADFVGPFSSGYRNAPIASFLVSKFAGEKWVQYEVRQSVAAIDDLHSRSLSGTGALGIDASNLILLLQGNVYKGFNCVGVTGTISIAAMAEIRHTVRSRVLELTTELEKQVPISASIEVGKPNLTIDPSNDVASRLTHQIVYGNITNISGTGNSANISSNYAENNAEALLEFLRESGIPDHDAKELAEIVQAEPPVSREEPLGKKAKNWLKAKAKSVTKSGWKISVDVATEVAKQAALKYFGYE